MPTREEIDTKERADRALRNGQSGEALGLYRSLLARVAVFEPGLYESWLEGALGAYRMLGGRRAVGFIQLALRRFAEVESALDPDQDPVPWALALGRQGRRKEAATRLSNSGLHVLAAREWEAAGDLVTARGLWERLARDPRLRVRPYEAALVHLMHARVERGLGHEEASEKHLVEAVSRLEALADEYETRGQRERAFDCYLLILRVGQGTGAAFENLAEGYVNAIRILVADGQRDFALQYMDDFIAAAAKRQEFHAAATMALDAADYSRRQALAFEQDFQRKAVELWRQAAGQSFEQGQAPELVENALAAALDAATSLADLPLMGKIYEAMSALPIEAERQARYAALAVRYGKSAVSPAPGPALPSGFKSAGAYQDIAWQDLIEWELDGSVESTLALIVVERTDHLRFVRAALLGLLVSADSPRWPEQPSGARMVAAALGDVEVYEVLAPLEKLALHAVPDVRAAAMTAAGKVLCKRSFNTIRIGLVDGEERVRSEARRALRGLHFRDGLEPLVRIFRESSDAAVKEAAVVAIADVPVLEAALVLLDIVREEEGPLRALAAERLCSFPSANLAHHVRAQLEVATGNAQQSMQVVLNALEAYRP